MGEYTKIAWADSTWNPWIGCTHAGTGCDHCYAETQNKYRKWNGGTWGNAAPRKVTAKGYWRKPLNWEDQARAGRVGKDSKRWLVFAGDLCDIFDRLGDNDARTRMWELFRRTPHLTWLILTKRPQHISEFLPADWGEGYRNVWLGVTVENRENGYPRIEALRRVPAALHFVSCEPLLEGLPDIDLTDIDWAIVGGESGSEARPFDIEWARAIKKKCQESSTTFFFKQLGNAPFLNGSRFNLEHRKPSGSPDNSGVVLENFPVDLRIQNWPMMHEPRIHEPQVDVLSSEPGSAQTHSKFPFAIIRNFNLRKMTLPIRKHASGHLEKFAGDHELVVEVEEYPDAEDEALHLVPRIRIQDAFISDPLEEPFLFDILGSKNDVEEALAESGVLSPLLLLLVPEQMERLRKTIEFDLPTYDICYVALHEDPDSSNWGKILSRTGLRYLNGSEDGICLLFSSDDGASVALALALARIQ
jgi:protein gp37